MKNVILYLTFIGIAITPIKTLAQDNNFQPSFFSWLVNVLS